MGLPGSGKTTLAKQLASMINAEWLNADIIRKEFNDWDFSLDGRLRQAKRMKSRADKIINDKKKNVIADFICPTPKSRAYFNADYIIWLDTIKKGRFEDTNQLFEPPKKFNFKVTTQNAEKWSIEIAKDIEKIILNEKN